MVYVFFFFKQKAAYELRISDWSSDVCSSDLAAVVVAPGNPLAAAEGFDRLVLVEPHRGRHRPGVGHEGGAAVVGEHEGLLRRQFVGAADRVVGHVAAGDLDRKSVV